MPEHFLEMVIQNSLMPKRTSLPKARHSLNRKSNLSNLGIYLTQVAPRCSIRGHGRLSSHADRIRGAFFDGRCLPLIPLRTALAGRIRLSSLRWPQSLDDGQRPGRLRDLRLSCLRDSRNDLREHPQGVDALVSGHLVDDVSEDGCQRSGFAEGSRFGQLQDRVDVVAQIASCYGAAGT